MPAILLLELIENTISENTAKEQSTPSTVAMNKILTLSTKATNKILTPPSVELTNQHQTPPPSTEITASASIYTGSTKPLFAESRPATQATGALSANMMAENDVALCMLSTSQSQAAATPFPNTTQSFGHIMPNTASGPLFLPNANNDWWMSTGLYGSASLTTPMKPTAVPSYANLSPLSKFMVDTAPNPGMHPNEHNWNALGNQQSVSDGVFNSTNLTSASHTDIPLQLPAPPLSCPMYPPSSPDPTNSCALNMSVSSQTGSIISSGVNTAGIESGASVNDAATFEELKEGQSKSRRRNRKDEVDLAYVLPDGMSRAHKPHRLGDESQWEGPVRKRARKK